MNLFTADVGQGKLHAYDSDRDIAYLKLDQNRLINLDIDGLESGDVIVIEDAHLRERVEGGLSMAHVFTIDELRTLYANAEMRQITILLFPHKKAPVVRKLAGYDPAHRKSNSVFMKEYKMSTDEADIRSLAKFLKRDKEEENFVHKGLAQRSFTRSWTVTDDTEVRSVAFEDGLLTVELGKIVPEHHARKDWL